MTTTTTLDHGNWQRVAKVMVTEGFTCAPEMDPMEKTNTTTVNPPVTAYSKRPTSPFISWVTASIPYTQKTRMKVPTISAKICIFVKLKWLRPNENVSHSEFHERLASWNVLTS